MGARGRKTAADKSAVNRHIKSLKLPPAPAYLSKDAKLEWTEIVKTYPSDRFPRATWPMLESYCTHAINVRRISQMLEAQKKPSMQEYNTLLVMLNRETKTLASFGVRLGIARTSMAGRHNNDPNEISQGGKPAPWQD